MTENSNVYEGGGLKGPLYWGAGVLTAGLAVNAIRAMQGGNGGWSNAATNAANAAVQYELASKQSRIDMLEAGRETDKKLVDVYTTLRAVDKEADAKIANLEKKVGEITATAPLRDQIMADRIDAVATLARNGIATNSAAIDSLRATVGSVVKTVIPNTSVCPGWGTVTVTPQGPFPFPPPPPPVNPPTPA